MTKLKTGTKAPNGELILLDKQEAAAIYARVNRSRLHLLSRLDDIDLVSDAKNFRTEPSPEDPPEVQLLFVLNQRRRECVDAMDEVAIARVMLQTMKEVRAEANRASAELGTLLMQQAKKSDLPTMAEVMKGIAK